ncbi:MULTISPECIES: NADH-quinone oxidoreductase subunit E [unclassified Rhizobium]|uniref:NADH-quinone oxidoreductase subunit E n=1 Tax=unclassified Rhizobium TaxID=2613769 RepID=UPI000DDEC56B|nr:MULTISPECIES: NADH-quinone oxidoreductase subunit E [unclassified Rhizobium]MBB3290262.1 NADH-quinone oxidoreductase subunit E [Rhizobium sp. BK252]MBB3405043.1 NADH-quinone oxidoreductase subunit E [Rhizobium sp. BK289]MBB3417589.1 NADH-quinone oxidoreductase subunit E [Rhizobium sp. BK284]MBB3485468.1 NADH-quinone oxidoreductase subunit E [Rhizobium sp. BK347]MDK4719920.1 NADH-quinone oxidoreductase subunit E [Rhizobium sp. CNPSo 3968]
MSVRRLAEDQFQPAAFAFNAENTVWAEKTIKKYPDGRQQSAIIPLMMRAQEQEGWVTKAAIETIADMLDMAYIRALEVATFYTQFQLHPVGTRAHVQVCGTTPCMLRGAEGLIKVCKSRINDHAFERNADGTLSWEEVECQGACVNAPMVVIGKDTYEDLTPARLEEIIDAFAAGKGSEVPTGPQIDRVFSAPEGGLTSLLSDEAKAKGAAGKAKTTAEAVSVPPSEAAHAKSTDAETNTSLKTPATAPKEAAKNAKAAETQPLSGTAASAAVSEKAGSAQKPSLDDKDRPAGIEKPAQPDNLQLISGVGPKIEGTLHEIGIFTFAQVASWNEAERRWVDGYLNFRGRIERDDWVRQAEALAKGGEAEYIKVFGKKPR